ncbi:putative oxidoreductase [Fusarium venenatum]|uniref:putative oxidoreductase n=1 Tax=Fusarium venenatum TaxID=56646 RepID=UPI001DD7E7DC|nr:putative oxidoreductase [Fusarium venenatum]
MGDEMSIRGPRNNFKFISGTRRTILIAGGIGIIPIIPMAEEATTMGVDYNIIYLGRSRAGMTYVDKLTQRHGEHATIWATDEHKGTRLNLTKHFGAEDPNGLRVYCCGPENLLTTVEAALEHAPSGIVHVERLFNPVVPLSSSNSAFDVLMAKSGHVLHILEDKKVLEVINDAGSNILSTCNKGLCGTCEVRVLEGTPEHRDVVLTAEERAENSSMMTYVSRCRSKSLVLDLW